MCAIPKEHRGRLEPFFQAGTLSCSPQGKLTGAVTGDILDPSTWVFIDEEQDE